MLRPLQPALPSQSIKLPNECRLQCLIDKELLSIIGNIVFECRLHVIAMNDFPVGIYDPFTSRPDSPSVLGSGLVKQTAADR